MARKPHSLIGGQLSAHDLDTPEFLHRRMKAGFSYPSWFDLFPPKVPWRPSPQPRYKAAGDRAVELGRARRVSMTDYRAGFQRLRRKSIIAALTSGARSCWVQWPQPGRIIVRRSSGTNFTISPMRWRTPGKSSTTSRSPAM